MNSIQAAQQFYKLLQAKNPEAQQRWREILQLAQQGDMQAIRAVRLIRSVMNSTRIGLSVYQRPVVTPAQIESLRQVLVQARYAYSPSVYFGGIG